MNRVSRSTSISSGKKRLPGRLVNTVMSRCKNIDRQRARQSEQRQSTHNRKKNSESPAGVSKEATATAHHIKKACGSCVYRGPYRECVVRCHAADRYSLLSPPHSITTVGALLLLLLLLLQCWEVHRLQQYLVLEALDNRGSPFGLKLLLLIIGHPPVKGAGMEKTPPRGRAAVVSAGQANPIRPAQISASNNN